MANKKYTEIDKFSDKEDQLKLKNLSKEKKILLLNLIKTSEELNEKEKNMLLSEIEMIPEEEFMEASNYMINNFDKIIETVRLKWSINWFFEKFDKIEKKIETLEKISKKSIEKQEIINDSKEQLSTEKDLNSYFV